VYAAAVVLWEALTGRRMVEGDSEAVVLTKVLEGIQIKPTQVNASLPKSLDVVTMRGLEPDPNKRYPTAREMAFALERAVGLASQREVGEWVERAATDALALRSMRIKEIESRSSPMLSAASQVDTVSDIMAAPRPSQVSLVGVPSGLEATPAPSAPLAGPGEDPSSVASRVTGFSTTSMPVTQIINPPRGTSTALFAMAGATMIFAGVALAALFLLARDRQPNQAAPIAAASPPTASAAPSPAVTASAEAHQAHAPPAAASADAPDGVPPAASTADAVPTVAPAATTAAATHHTSTAGKAPPKPTAAAHAAPKADCDPPYTIDAQGIKRLKQQCF
jgi:eukaryotic-like serine/threonine-protein kinase